MPVVPSDLVTQWSTDFLTLFLAEYNQTQAVDDATLNQLITEIPMGDHQGNTVQLDWLGAAPQMRQWKDEKQAQGLLEHNFSAKVLPYEASIEVDLNALRDARFNPYEARIREMAQNGARLRYNLTSDLIKNGGSTKCYDGSNFFDTSHSEGASGTQSNKINNTGQSAAAIKADYYTAMTALCGFLDDKGVPLAPSMFRPLIWVPNNPALVSVFEDLQGAAMISQTSNVLANKFDLVIDPRLSPTSVSWFMFRRDGALKPFIFVNREAPHYRDNFAAETGDPFERRIGKASVEARAVATYGLWQRSLMIN